MCIRDSLIDELRFHAAVKQLLLGMINDLSFFPHDKQVAFAPQVHIGTKLLYGTVVHVLSLIHIS